MEGDDKMIYMTCDELRDMLNNKFEYKCVHEIYLNEDGSIYGAIVGNMYFDVSDLMEKTCMQLDLIRILNPWNLKLWKEISL